jgi:hypothetical protein
MHCLPTIGVVTRTGLLPETMSIGIARLNLGAGTPAANGWRREARAERAGPQCTDRWNIERARTCGPYLALNTLANTNRIGEGRERHGHKRHG